MVSSARESMHRYWMLPRSVMSRARSKRSSAYALPHPTRTERRRDDVICTPTQMSRAPPGLSDSLSAFATFMYWSVFRNPETQKGYVLLRTDEVYVL